MTHFLHRLAHRLGVNRGSPAFLKRGGRYYRCFRCDECGEVQFVSEMSYTEALSWARDYSERWELGPAKSGRR